ncbi:MAG TPA: DUF711 family protein [Steroidobacteraceae bacterium]|nr:DUF711 family protein [Steroidobacteraceae bacterium]
MTRRAIWVMGWVLFSSLTVAAPLETPQSTLPKVRAITAFVRLDRTRYVEQIGETLGVLRAARREFAQAGYQVETLRIVTQPLAELVSGASDEEALAFLKAFDELSVKEDFLPNVGPAMLKDEDDPRAMRLLGRALATLSHLNGSALIAADDGIHWRVIHESAILVRSLAEHSPHSQGNFNFTATAMLAPYGPFYPGAYFTGEDRRFSIGLEGAGLVARVFARTRGDFKESVAQLTRELTVHAKRAQAVGEQVSAATRWTFMGVDPTPAPLADVSIGAAIEAYTGARFGSSGTLTAALAITSAVKAVPVRQIGYSGLMVPVMEDKLLAQRWSEGAYGIDDLLAYSAVCGTGLDTVPLPGDVSAAQLERIFGDVAALAWKWHKPLSARLQPVAGKQAGESTEFRDPFLFNTTLHVLP